MTDEAVIEFATAGCKTMADDTLRLQIDIEPRFADKAFELFGKRGIAGAIVRLNLDHATLVEPAPEPEVDHGPFWQDLFRSGFFRAPAVLRAIGPEGEFEDWIRNQPSVLDGAMDTVLSELDQCYKQRNQCCHVRRVSRGAGTGQKPPYFAVPMTSTQHRLQHDKGEAAVIEKYRHGFEFVNAANDAAAVIAKDWFTRQADRLQTDWASNALAARLRPGFRSRKEIGPDEIYQWAAENGLDVHFPAKWRPQ